MNRLIRNLLTAVLLTALLSGLCFTVSAEGTGKRALVAATSIEAGESYVLSGLDLSASSRNMVNANYCVVAQTTEPQGLEIAPRPISSGELKKEYLWTATSAGAGYAFYSESAGKYLSLSGGVASLSEKKQALAISKVGGMIRIGSGKNQLTFTNKDYARWSVSDNGTLITLYTVPTETVHADYEETAEPLLTVACFADLHVDYGIQSHSVPVRPSTQKAAELLKNAGGADVILVGGDITSVNSKSDTWSEATFRKVQMIMHETLSSATKDGDVLYVAGNHEYQAGCYSTPNFNSGSWEEYLPEGITDPLYEKTAFGDNLIAYRYTVRGIEILCLSSPFISKESATGATSPAPTPAQINWLKTELRTIGKKNTVLIVSHYPPTDSKWTSLTPVLTQYPNAVYCYGHQHGTDYRFAWYDTAELVTGFTEAGTADTPAKSTSFMTCHMGSMGAYQNRFNGYAGLNSSDPYVVQFNVIRFYRDHITFGAVNAAHSADDAVPQISTFTVLRDMVAQMCPEEAPKTDPDTSASSDPATDTTNLPATDTAEETDNGTLIRILIAVLIAVLAAAAVAVVMILRKNKKPKNGGN